KLHKKITSSTFKNSNYVALRERISVDMARNVFRGKTNLEFSPRIVPDTAFDIDKMWPLNSNTSIKYICVNLNERYHKPIDETARNLDKISNELKMPIKFIIIGDCHGDQEFTKEVSNKMKSDHHIVES